MGSEEDRDADDFGDEEDGSGGDEDAAPRGPQERVQFAISGRRRPGAALRNRAKFARVRSQSLRGDICEQAL